MSARISRRRRPGFTQDLARMFDFAGAMDGFVARRRRRRASFAADADALKSDWEAVGHDLRRAIERFEHEYLLVQ